MSRFGDSANGPSVLDISNISGVSDDIETLADHATAISNLGPVATEISNLGTTAVIADMSALGTQAVRDDMDALADVTTELGVLGNATTAGYIAAIGTSTVGATSQLTVDALGQLTSEISLLASNITTLQNSASNSPIQLANLSDVNFQGNTPSVGDTIVYDATNSEFRLQALPGAGPLSGTNLTETSPQTDQILKISAVNSGVPEYVNATVSALVYDAGFDNITEVAAATPAAAGEVVHYDGISAWTVGQLAYSEITGTPNLQPVATGGASTDLSDTANLVYQSSGTITGDYEISGNLDIATGYELRVDTIDPYPDGVPSDGSNPGTLTILGNLQVDGTTTTINSTTLTVNDKSVTLSTPTSGNTTFSAMNGAGIDVDTTGMSAVWTTNTPAITYSTTSGGNAADAQTWDINRGVVAKGWSDGTSSYDGQLTLNCSANSHGITIKSAPHADNATYDLILPANAPAGGKVLAQNSGNTQLEFIDVVKPNDNVALGNVEATNVIVDAGASDAAVEIGKGRTAAGNAYFDLVTVGSGTNATHEDYGFRMFRGSGENPSSQINHRGTGELRFQTEDVSAMRFSTNAQAALLLHANQKVQMPDYGTQGNTGTAAYSLAVDASGYIIEEQDVSATALPQFAAVNVRSAFYPTLSVKMDGQTGVGQFSHNGAHVDIRNTATDGSGDMRLFTQNTQRMTIDYDGGLRLHNYTGAGTHIGTAVKSLAVDSSGNVIEEPLGATVGVAAAMAIVF